MELFPKRPVRGAGSDRFLRSDLRRSEEPALRAKHPIFSRRRSPSSVSPGLRGLRLFSGCAAPSPGGRSRARPFASRLGTAAAGLPLLRAREPSGLFPILTGGGDVVAPIGFPQPKSAVSPGFCPRCNARLVCTASHARACAGAVRIGGPGASLRNVPREEPSEDRTGRIRSFLYADRTTLHACGDCVASRRLLRRPDFRASSLLALS